ncbi:hypothetical protein CROQUDRAFT_658453 [Cronartium quercuum f. sp. fusiforme G11]|uniref:cyclin-dependent kinase n=1 Tax=Cronartium quercuum f. sp. fusiforme G11 TaxID=708437 RepID=A0A9P6NJZ1_9BASI|nr:hypothetical protein CROQUDRAFT_658453 [Cronartium quercuum f. sp. fusiforme G11]
MNAVELSAEIPIRSTWIPLPQIYSAWTDLFKAPLDPKSKLNSHPAIIRQSEVSSNHDLIKKPHWITIKRVDLGLKRYPHDIKREAKILSSLDHKNIVPLLATSHDSPTFSLYIPFYPITLTQLLQSSKPEFTPNFPAFYFLTKKIIHQLASGLSYIHERGIAHRDVAPSNVVFDQMGTAIWIDFGTAWSHETAKEELDQDKLEFELGTMPYRAPELLFGSRHYLIETIDQWSFGVLISEFFTPLIKRSDYQINNYARFRSEPMINNNEALFSFGIDEHDQKKEENVLDWYNDTSMLKFPEEEQNWSLPNLKGEVSIKEGDQEMERKTLFIGDSGDIGLVNSIFKILGTPDHSTWPESKDLPDFSKLQFHIYSPKPIETLLPNLYPKNQNQIKEEENLEIKNFINLIQNLLIYQSTDRLTSFQVISHPYLNDLKDQYDGKSYRDWMSYWILPS